MIGRNENIKVATGVKVTFAQIIIVDFEGNSVLIYDHNGKLAQILSDKLNKPTDIEIVDNTIFVVNYRKQTITVYEG